MGLLCLPWSDEMKMVMFWNALRAGETLTNPTKWKDRQDTVNAVVAILGLLLWIVGKAGMPLEISENDLAVVAGGVAVVLGAVNAYLTTATTEKKGFVSKQKNRIEGD
jgi:hypothetical protein